MTLTIHSETPLGIVVTGPGPELMQAMLTPRRAQSLLWSAERALQAAKAALVPIRELRRLTGNRMDDWCRGEARYRVNRRDGLARVMRCRAAVAHAQDVLARAERQRRVMRWRWRRNRSEEMTDPITDAAQAAYEALSTIPAAQHNAAMRYIAGRLRADRNIAAAQQSGGKFEPTFWLPAEDDAAEDRYETPGSVVLESDRDHTKVHAVIGYGPVARKFVVLVPIGDEGGFSYDVDLFDNREEAQRLVDSINGAPTDGE